MATYTPIALAIGTVTLGTSATTIYTVPAGATLVIKKFTVYNANAADRTITIDTSAANSALVTALNVVALTSLDVTRMEGHVFNAGEVIRGLASAATSVRIARISGLLIT